MEKVNRFAFLIRLSNLFVILIFMLLCGTAIGEEKNDEFTLEEIVVTAEFREKAIQDTPLSITAMNADMLEMRNMVSVEQIALQSPNVSLKPANSAFGSSLVAYIRGIGQTDFSPSVESGVGIYVDDVYFSTITGNVLDLLDLERVEILRGPQGTLAGRNALGGAIKLISRKPEGKNEGYFSTTFGSSDRLDIKGAGDFSISDKLFMRVAGTSRSRDGYITSYDYACRNNTPDPGQPGGLPTYVNGVNCELGTEGGQSMTAGRISLRYVPNDNIEINFAANMVNDNSEGQPSILLQARDMSTNTIPIYFDNNANGVYNAGIDMPYGNHFATPGTYYNYSTYIDDGKSTPDPTKQGGTPGRNLNLYKPNITPRINKLEAKDYTLNFDWLLTENVSLKSITSYREYTNSFGNDGDHSPLSLYQMFQIMDHDQFTQEFRLNSTLFDGFADTTFGVFYLDDETKFQARVDINYSGFDFLHGPDLVPAKSKAAYGQTTLHFTDRLNLTLGARYSDDEKSYSFRRRNPDGSTILPPGPGSPYAANQPANSLQAATNGLSVAYSSSKFDYRVALDYNFTEKIMGYVQVASGYRAGGNNARPFYPSQIYAYDPEEVVNYEAGIKSTLFDQIRLNSSVFFNDYSNIQLPLTICFFAPVGQQTPCGSQANVGDAEVKGFELEGMWQPTKPFSLDFSFAYIDFEYTKLRLTQVSPDSATPYTPEYKWNVGAQYRFKLDKYGDITPRLDVSFQDDIFTSAINTTTSAIESYYLSNASLTWRSEDLKWQASLEVSNLTDKYYYLTVFDALSRSGFVSGQPGRPREYAFTIKRTWYFE